MAGCDEDYGDVPYRKHCLSSKAIDGEYRNFQEWVEFTVPTNELSAKPTRLHESENTVALRRCNAAGCIVRCLIVFDPEGTPVDAGFVPILRGDPDVVSLQCPGLIAQTDPFS